MKKRFILSFTSVLGFLVLVLACSGRNQTVEAKEKIPEPKIGIIDLARVKEVVPHFSKLEKLAEVNRRLLEEFTAQVLAEHQQKIRSLSSEDYSHSQELAAAAQNRIDQKKRELAAYYQREERAVLEELEAVVAKVAKDKKFDCILLKGGLQVGGEDVTEKVIKTWDKWGLTFWQRVKLFFGGKDPRSNRNTEETTG